MTRKRPSFLYATALVNELSRTLHDYAGEGMPPEHESAINVITLELFAEMFMAEPEFMYWLFLILRDGDEDNVTAPIQPFLNALHSALDRWYLP